MCYLRFCRFGDAASGPKAAVLRCGDGDRWEGEEVEGLKPGINFHIEWGGYLNWGDRGLNSLISN